MANRDSQNAPYPVNSMPPKVLPIRSWMTPPISWASPPKANATAKTTGRVPMLTRLALIMLSMKVVVAKPARASGAEFPHATALAGAGPLGAGELAAAGWVPWSMEAM